MDKFHASRILSEPSGSKAATNNHLSLSAFERCGNHTELQVVLLPYAHLRNVGEPTCHPCSTTGMMQNYHFLQLGATWDIFLLAGIAMSS